MGTVCHLGAGSLKNFKTIGKGIAYRSVVGHDPQPVTGKGFPAGQDRYALYLGEDLDDLPLPQSIDAIGGVRGFVANGQSVQERPPIEPGPFSIGSGLFAGLGLGGKLAYLPQRHLEFLVFPGVSFRSTDNPDLIDVRTNVYGYYLAGGKTVFIIVPEEQAPRIGA